MNSEEFIWGGTAPPPGPRWRGEQFDKPEPVSRIPPPSTINIEQAARFTTGGGEPRRPRRRSSR